MLSLVNKANTEKIAINIYQSHSKYIISLYSLNTVNLKIYVIEDYLKN